MEKMTELRNLIELFGTKMAYLIFYLRYLFRELPESRVIVFSQVCALDLPFLSIPNVY